jgi:hypothetical protein
MAIFRHVERSERIFMQKSDLSLLSGTDPELRSSVGGRARQIHNIGLRRTACGLSNLRDVWRTRQVIGTLSSPVISRSPLQNRAFLCRSVFVSVHFVSCQGQHSIGGQKAGRPLEPNRSLSPRPAIGCSGWGNVW